MPADRPIWGLLSALPEEQLGLVDLLDDVVPPVLHAGRQFVQGRLAGHRVVLALCGIGKVAAAATTAMLVERFGVERLVFTGVAGGLSPGARIGDVVVADGFMQHDMDASPLFPRYEIPLYGRALFDADADLSNRLDAAARIALADPVALCGPEDRARFLPDEVRVHRGLLVSGDRFVSALKEAADLRAGIPAAMAVDMESAAVAQVCRDYGVRFAAVRTISDRADDSAHVDFPAFVETVASRYASAIVAALFRDDAT
ncbi:5'-methylthioadenosine/adenosylhomocysteine nucleosidase [Xylophilus sp. GOD-11R]|uniref:5'-methylthioadenosine/adenosylhomocysteine nucleosidase n=1 Tax=Xylophilus sp. GOD-11R TaxID=3089814 RepID=UPI00298C289B|nr:5'-methylthioadenosine/adenosylhomocysteine nucleosidase [Xylophilus sp. GOD-11R]WPB57208.1 5'-methylthioadenosine/adenosylhomocysteine nucleosidase [Xylophilus sp. GOD-11R]